VDFGDDRLVQQVRPANQANVWINAGFFAFKQEIFDYLREGEDLVSAPFQRLIAERQLLAYPHEGFWACMDTYKDKNAFDEMDRLGRRPWQLW
jgi:glucose-1-phosphate cytidylyltransferase